MSGQTTTPAATAPTGTAEATETDPSRLLIVERRPQRPGRARFDVDALDVSVLDWHQWWVAEYGRPPTVDELAFAVGESPGRTLASTRRVEVAVSPPEVRHAEAAWWERALI
ncbi:MAG: hypothetical protein GY713_22890 [Actinomycetia bacterium]|nr:hypothetical protein [Actinomycetes bacterium]